MSDQPYADDDLAQLVQAAFDKYILDKLPSLIEKHMPLVDECIATRIGNCASPKINTEIFNRVESIVETTVGNYLRVGLGRSIIDSTITAYLDKKMEEHIEQQVKCRVNRLMERLKKQFDEALGGDKP